MHNDILVDSKKRIDISVIRGYLYIVFKRTFDVICSLFGCILLLPIMLVIKIASLITKDYDSIIFTQDRIGKDGKTFRLYKFRSMISNADEVLNNLLETDEDAREEYRVNKKLAHDPRITKLGNFIRKTSIDELPQLINILKGDMSFIGNRPYLPREKDDMGIYYNDIIKTRPGLTGYWQVSGRSDTTFEERLKLEKKYSNMANLKLDIKIFFKTFKVVLCKDGAK